MTLKDYFNMGRDSERKYESKQKVRHSFRRVTKPSPFSLGGIVMGAGVMYQMVMSKIKPEQKPNSPPKEPNPTIEVIKGDIQTAIDKIQGANPEWEKYRNFLELAKGKR